jgi:hypothetical protein
LKHDFEILVIDEGREMDSREEHRSNTDSPNSKPRTPKCETVIQISILKDSCTRRNNPESVLIEEGTQIDVRDERPLNADSLRCETLEPDSNAKCESFL